MVIFSPPICSINGRGDTEKKHFCAIKLVLSQSHPRNGTKFPHAQAGSLGFLQFLQKYCEVFDLF